MTTTTSALSGSKFGIWDYVVLSVMLLISAAIGVYYRFTGGRQKTTQEYLLGDRSLSTVPVAFSLMASFMSAITLMGVSTENYMYGTQFVVINIAYGIATPIAAYWFLPVFFRLQTTSAYHYLELRFGKLARVFASLAFSLQMILYMGIVLYAPALAIEAVTHVSKVAAMLVVGLVCTFYSTIGGMKAVVITDVFQSLLMFTAVVMVCVKGSIDAGGLGEVWRIAQENGRIEFDNFNPNPTQRHTWWSLVIGGGFTYLSIYAVNQAQVQRLLSLKSLKRSQKALWVSWPVLSILSLSTSFAGLAIYSRYYKCDPIKLGRISKSDQLMPLFVVDTMSDLPGLSGLFVAGIFSGSLSTVSSAVNSLAAVTLEDYVKPVYYILFKRDLPDSRTSMYSKLLALLYGMVCLAVAFLVEHLGGLLEASLTIFGIVGGPLLGLFTLGMFFMSCNQKGAIAGLLSGLAVGGYLGFAPKPAPQMLPTSIEGCYFHNTSIFTNSWSNHTTPAIPTESPKEYIYLSKLSYLWCIVVGFLITLLVGNLVSWITNCSENSSRSLDPKLFSPLIRKLVKKQQAKILLNHPTTPSVTLGNRDCAVLAEEPKLLQSSPL